MALVAPTEAPVIEVSHVSTRFGPAIVHQDVSLTVIRGEVFAIAGGNGCGKSTLLREIIGLLTPTTGASGFWVRTVASWSSRTDPPSIGGSG